MVKTASDIVGCSTWHLVLLLLLFAAARALSLCVDRHSAFSSLMYCATIHRGDRTSNFNCKRYTFRDDVESTRYKQI